MIQPEHVEVNWLFPEVPTGIDEQSAIGHANGSSRVCSNRTEAGVIPRRSLLQRFLGDDGAAEYRRRGEAASRSSREKLSLASKHGFDAAAWAYRIDGYERRPTAAPQLSPDQLRVRRRGEQTAANIREMRTWIAPALLEILGEQIGQLVGEVVMNRG